MKHLAQAGRVPRCGARGGVDADPEVVGDPAAADCPECLILYRLAECPEGERCPECRSTGDCTLCDGSGEDSMEYLDACFECGGTGSCDYCEGTGECLECREDIGRLEDLRDKAEGRPPEQGVLFA